MLFQTPLLSWKRLIFSKSARALDSIPSHPIPEGLCPVPFANQDAFAGTAAMEAVTWPAAAPPTPSSRGTTPRSPIAGRDRRGPAAWAAARRRTARTARPWAPGHGTWRTSTVTRAARTRPAVAAAHATRTGAPRPPLRRGRPRRRPSHQFGNDDEDLDEPVSPTTVSPSAYLASRCAWDTSYIATPVWPLPSAPQIVHRLFIGCTYSIHLHLFLPPMVFCRALGAFIVRVCCPPVYIFFSTFKFTLNLFLWFF